MLKNNPEIDDVTPLEFYLGQNYPNPFKDKTIIKYCIAYKTRVKLTIFNSESKEIEKLVDEEKTAGAYEIEFQSIFGDRQLEAGDYYYCLKAGDYTNEKKMLLQK